MIFFKNASVDDLAEFLARFGATLVYASVGIHKDIEEIKETEPYKQLYEEYQELLRKEI